MANNEDIAPCPLCGKSNDCQLCTAAAYQGSCWCQEMEIPAPLLARVPADLRNKACICRACVTEFHRTAKPVTERPKILPGDFYFENGLMVFNAAYHLRRGYCCGSGCRHCPYPPGRSPITANG